MASNYFTLRVALVRQYLKYFTIVISFLLHSPMEITIREYQESDYPQLKTLVEKLQDYLVDIDPEKIFRRTPEYGEAFTHDLVEAINSAEGKIFIAFDNDKIIGFSAGSIDIPSKKDSYGVVPSKVGVISEIFVDQEYRGKGIGTSLLTKLEDYFKTTGCNALWLNVATFNPAYGLYQKRGYHDKEVGMFKKF